MILPACKHLYCSGDVGLRLIAAKNGSLRQKNLTPIIYVFISKSTFMIFCSNRSVLMGWRLQTNWRFQAVAQRAAHAELWASEIRHRCKHERSAIIFSKPQAALVIVTKLHPPEPTRYAAPHSDSGPSSSRTDLRLLWLHPHDYNAGACRTNWENGTPAPHLMTGGWNQLDNINYTFLQ